MDNPVYKKKDIEYNEDVKLQIYNLICKFAYEKPQVTSILRSKDEVTDFIHYAYIYYIEKLYPIYDSTKSALSTHVFTFLNKMYYLFITQAQQNVGLKDARRMAGSGRRNKLATNYYNAIYRSSSLNTGLDGIICNELDGSTEDIVMPDCNMVSDDSDPYEQMINTNVYETKEEMLQTYIGQAFEDALNRYFDRRKVKEEIRERDKDIIWKYTFKMGNGTTLQSLGELYGGLSRERVRQICERFYEWARRDKKFREELKP